MPKISVIIPVYNAENYLEKCLDSVLNQTYKHIEVIIINDGSTDNSQLIIDKYRSKYTDRIRCFETKNNGLSAARNFGISQATGDYISFVDSDDFLDKNLFDQLHDVMMDKIDLIKFKMIKVNNQYSEIEKIDGPVFAKVDGETAFNMLVFNDLLLEPACLYLYKKEIFDEKHFSFAKDKFHEDFGLIPLIIATSNTVSSINLYGYYYLQTNESITRNSNYNKKYQSTMDLLFHYDNLLKQLENFNLDRYTIKNLKQYYTNAIILATINLNKKDRREYIREIERRKLTRNIHPKNLKQFLKKLILNININLYLKLKGDI